MREVRDEPDEVGDGDRVERARPGGGDTGAVRERIEPRDRSEYAAELEQRDAGHRARRDADHWAQPDSAKWAQRDSGDGAQRDTEGWAQPDSAKGAQRDSGDGTQRDAGGWAQGDAGGWAQRDGGGGAERLARPGEGAAGGDFPQARLEVLRGFRAERAGLRGFGDGEVAAYLEAHQDERPWLAAARDRPPEVQLVFAVLDSGGGHAHIRHEGWVTEEMNRRRVAYLEDPAQLDPLKRAAGIDGITSGGQPHRCGSVATRVADPDAFAEAITRGVEHPDVRAALEADFGRRVPGPVVLPIADLLGSEGHRYCTGWQLEPVDGSIKAARECRDAWALGRGETQGSPRPEARPVETFDGGTTVFIFGPNRARNGYEIVTMYVNPPEGA